MSNHPNNNKYDKYFEEQAKQEVVYAQYRRQAAMRARRCELKRRRRKVYMFRTATVTVALLLVVGIFTAITAGTNAHTNSAADAAGDAEVSENTSRLTEVFQNADTVPPKTNEQSSEQSEQQSSEQEAVLPVYTYETDSKFEKDYLAAASSMDEKITSAYVLLYDATNDKILYEKNANEKCYPASTTKLLTAIVSQKIIPEDMEITVGDEIDMIGEDSSVAYLQKGYVMNYEMLLQGLLLPSGNDAAYVLAVNSARIYTGNPDLGNEEALEVFAALMNDAAKQLGATDTHFVVPDGFHDDDHYTTAADLAKIANYAYSVPIINKTMSTFAVNCELISGEVLYWENSNSLINPYSNLYNKNVNGMKTGFTDQAGTCVVASAEADGAVMIAVVMNAQNLYQKYEDALLLFRNGFDSVDLTFE